MYNVRFRFEIKIYFVFPLPTMCMSVLLSVVASKDGLAWLSAPKLVVEVLPTTNSRGPAINGNTNKFFNKFKSKLLVNINDVRHKDLHGS